MTLELAIALTLVGDVIIIGALILTRQAFVSLNKDMRAMLDRQATIRARLERLEVLNQIGHDVVMAKTEKKTWTN